MTAREYQKRGKVACFIQWTRDEQKGPVWVFPSPNPLSRHIEDKLNMNVLTITPSSGSFYPSNTTMNERSRIWIVDDDKSIRWVLEKAFARESLDVTSFENGDAMMVFLDNHPLPDVILSDVRMPGTDGIRMLNTLK